MKEEVEVQVDLDTRRAASELRSLQRRRRHEQRRSRSQIWGKMRARVGNAIGLAAGYAATSASARIGANPVDPWDAALSPFRAKAQQFIDQGLGFSAKARKEARADTIQRLAQSAGATGSTMAAEQYFRVADNITQHEEAGRNIVRQVVLGPSLADLIEQSTKGWFLLVEKGFDYVYDRLIG